MSGGSPIWSGPRVGWQDAPWVAVMGIVLTSIVISNLYIRIGRGFAPHSDDATGVLEAEAVLHGNFLLRGWTVSNASFYATDLPFYVVGVYLRGVHPSLLHDVPAVIYAFTVALATALGG